MARRPKNQAEWDARYSAPRQRITDERAAEILGAVRAESGDALAAGPRFRQGEEAPPVSAEQNAAAILAQREKVANVIAEMNLATHNW